MVEPIERDLDKIIKSGTLTVLTPYNSTSYFIYRGEPFGYEYELLQVFAKEHGLELKMVVVTDQRSIFALLKPALALGSWVAFKKSGDMTRVMGDLVLSEDEATPVMTKLEEGGVMQTALHNHVLHESPRIMYMHISATGDALKIAKAIHDALSLSKTPFAASAAPSGQTRNIQRGISHESMR
jgi:hypothetical protein